MNDLQLSKLLLVGNIEEKRYFENYFQEVIHFDSNKKILKEYKKNLSSTIFLDCDLNKDVLNVCRKIREDSHSIVIVFLTSRLDRITLQEALPLHLSGCIFRPLEKKEVERVLLNVKKDLVPFRDNNFNLKENYSFHLSHQVLYNASHQEIKLTKNERHLLNILIKSKDEFLDGVAIEHKIWEYDSVEVDCSNRLKNLLYTLRKKLPKDTILNQYKLGYKLIY